MFPYVTGQRLGVVILSLVLGHTAWHWMEDGGHRLEHAATALASTSSVPIVGWWMFLGLLVGGAAWFLPEQFDRGGPDGAQRFSCDSMRRSGTSHINVTKT